MTNVKKTTGVHEKTVKDAAKHAAANAPKRKGRGPSKSSSVSKINVDPRVWIQAKELADGDLGRLKVVSPTEVIVNNK